MGDSCGDPDDDKFVECADEARRTFRDFDRTKVVSTREPVSLAARH
jgi:hypothetical protein